MKTGKIKHTGLEQTLRGMQIQIYDSIPWCEANIPRLSSHYELFAYLKPQLTYVKDQELAKNKYTDYLQEAKTMMEDNGGMGDCDCFTILWIASCIAQGWDGNYIALKGRKKVYPSHVHAKADIGGDLVPFDLTNALPGTEREYKYYQDIKFF